MTDYILPTNAAEPVAEQAPTETQVNVRRPDRGDLPLPLAAAGGAALTAATYFAMKAVGPGYLYTLVLERGWMQYASLFLAWTALVMLAGRAWRAWAAHRDLASVSRLPGITPAARKDRSALLELRERWGRAGGAAGLRRARAIQAYLSTGTRSAATAAADDDTAQAESALDAAYAAPRVAVWSIPLIGFIGTVVGISAAVAGFAGFLQTAEEIEQIKSGIGGVTTGLAVAFDTTLLALALSVAVMIPLVLLERFERRLILILDADTHDQVIERLPEPDGVAHGTAPIDEASMRRVVQAVLRETLPSSEAMVEDARTYLRTAATEVARSAHDAARSIDEASRSIVEAQAASRVLAERASAESRERLELRDREALGALAEMARAILAEQKASAQAAQAEANTSATLMADAVREAAHPLHAIAGTLSRRVEELESLSRQTREVLAVEQSVHRSIEALQQTGRLQEVLGSVEASLQTLRPAIERLALPRTITLVEADGAIRPMDGARGNS